MERIVHAPPARAGGARIHRFKSWLKAGETPLAGTLYSAIKAVRGFEVPVVPGLHLGLYALHRGIRNAIAEVMRVFYWTPLFRSRLRRSGRGINLYGGMPLVLGSIEIEIGDGCRISGQTTFSGRSASQRTPRLIVGKNCGIGWQTTISVGSRVVLGDNVRISGRAYLAGYPGHPLDAAARASGKPDTDDQVGDIVLEDDVWLGTGVTVNAGVNIGRGTIVAGGSVVTRDLPPGVLAGGVPAKVIRAIDEHLQAKRRAKGGKGR